MSGSCGLSICGASSAMLTSMSDVFDYVRHPHVSQRKESGPPNVAEAAISMHGPGPIGRFNANVGLKITMIVGTMWTAYIFTLLTLVSAPAAFHSGDRIIIVSWIAQTFLQLVLLPIIIVGQNTLAAASDARAEIDHETLLAIRALSLLQLGEQQLEAKNIKSALRTYQDAYVLDPDNSATNYFL